MSTSASKAVKGATKPKHALPKSKYLEPILAASFTDEDTLSDVLRALSDRLKEPNATVVFKSLIVVHQLFRTGSTENVLGFLAREDVLRLKRVSNGQWEGYNTPQHLQAYGAYLDSRVRAYRELKHDVIRAQTDRRGSSLDRTGRPTQLRNLTVEKGLLREVKEVQKMVDTLTECKFFLDDLEDDLTVTALQMNVKDLLALFTAVNEGVINVLEHYFEMSKVDATEALKIYKKFCRQTEDVVEYLAIARRLHNVLNVMIPNLKHAPVSLHGALQEYLNDPNFEQNRLEYKANKDVADKGSKSTSTSTPAKPAAASSAPIASTSSAPASSAQPSSSTSAAPASASQPADANKSLVDFFASIESEQTSMFGNNTSPTAAGFPPHQQPQQPFNPFFANGAQPQQAPFLQAQPTGFPNQPFAQPQQNAFTGMPPPQQQQPQATGFPGGLQPQPPSFPGALQPQATGFPGVQQPQATGFPGGGLQPQATGFNPFRQSMLLPQATGAFGGLGQPNGFLGASQPEGLQPMRTGVPQQPFNGLASQPTGAPFNTTPSSPSPFAAANTSSPPIASPFPSVNRVASPAPAGSAPQTQLPQRPLTAQATGSRNPFAPPGGVPQKPPPVPEIPKGPSLNVLAANAFANLQQQQQQQQQQQPLTANPTGLSSIASSFAFTQPNNASPAPPTSPPPTSAFSSLSVSSPSVPLASSPQPGAASPSALTPQPTSFGGSTVKRFVPTSNFGASLEKELGASAFGRSSPALGAQPTGLSAQPTGLPGSTTSPFAASSAFGSSFSNNLTPGGLAPQATGAPNPFRMSMMPTGGAFGGAFGGGGGATGLSRSNTLAIPSGGANLSRSNTLAVPSGPFAASNAFGSSAFGAGAGGATGQQQEQPQQQQPQQQQPQQQTFSLI